MRTKRRKMMAVLACCFVMVTILASEGIVNAEDNEHAFGILSNKGVSENQRGPLFRGTWDTNNPWRIRMTITTDTVDRTTIYWLRLTDNTEASIYLHVHHGENFATNAPYAISNQKYVKLMARDNNNNNGAYWTAGQWYATTW